jgi:dihydrofolate reductase
MRKLRVNTFLTLDGVMQAPGGPEEDPSGGFTHGGWSVPYWDETLNTVMGQFMTPPFDLLLGRRTYEIFASYWPTSTEPGAEQLNAAHKYVASRTLTDLAWRESTLLEGDVAEAVGRLKAGSGAEIQVHGSGDLLQTLLEHDLVDEFQICGFPVLIGSGKRLFADGTRPAGLRTVSTTTSGTGVVIARYERAGDIRTGTFVGGGEVSSGS